MLSPLFAIDGPWPGILAIAPAPASGPHLKRALMRWQKLGITSILSLMKPGERPGWEKEAAICAELGIDFISIPISDHSVPYPAEMENIAARLQEIEERLQSGERIVAHCFAGIGRSGMATIALLILGGVPLQDAIHRVSTARGLSCPETEAQLEWLESFDRYRRLSYT